MANTTSTSKPQSAMAQLLAAQKSKIVTLKKGESVSGKLTKLTSSEIMVEVGSKTEALVLEKDKRILNSILSTFHVGDTVDVNVLNPESDSGQPIVSLRRFLANRSWKMLEELQKSKEDVQATISDVAKAGYVIATDFGVSGFLPQSHISYSQQQDLKQGAAVTVTVFELNRKDNKVIFSQKTALSDEEFGLVTKQLKTGAKVSVTITNLTNFGLFVSVTLPKAVGKNTTVEGFIHISEAAWDKVSDLNDLYTAGQTVEAVVTKFDAETRRVNLSIKRLTEDPFEETMVAFPVDKKVVGTVTKIEETGVTLTFEGSEDIEGLIKKEKIPVGTTYHEGQTVNAVVSEHDKKRHRLVLVPVLKEKPMGYR